MNEIGNLIKTIQGKTKYVFSEEFVKNNMYLMGLVVLLCIAIIENRYACDKQFNQIKKLKLELQDKKNDALAVNAELSQISRQSNVKVLISESGVDVAESTLPPFMIKK
ncbi:MAG: hypothetical protein KBT22_01955 [Bacteroidales bacterium]|nr:hypothetical protein [Candidatus Scybalocola fimicaballi]